jgi:glycosyltransferase involved in cell wall biosynthesis
MGPTSSEHLIEVRSRSQAQDGHVDPLVTFVVPCYKLAHLLPECVNSILAQTHRDFEVLIMDNCSPDNTPEVARSFDDPRVKYIRNETNIGHVRNYNKGISVARGKYVWWISADDFLRSPEVLRRFVDLMERNPQVGYVFCRAYEVQGSREVGVAEWTDCGARDKIWKGSSFLKQLIKSNCIVMASVMARKECYDNIGLFPVDLPFACDWYLWCVFALHYHVAYFAEPMVCCRIHEESLTTSFYRGSAPVCIVDELNVIWRVARRAELSALPRFKSACHASLAKRTARALNTGNTRDARPGLNEAEFETLLRKNVSSPADQVDIRARIYEAVGDEHYWAGKYRDATISYRLGIQLRPWQLKTWAKYVLLRMGNIGIGIRQLFSSIAAAA